MNLKEQYDHLYSECKKAIKLINFQIDENINSNTDDRYGVTLLIRPPIEIKNRIQLFLNELKEVEPTQYYYNNSDIHITVLSIISCYSGFKLDQINISDYSRLIAKSIADSKSFRISFKGITATLNSIMVQGFINDTTLNDIRDNLRVVFENSDLEQSIDKRYALKTAHSTVVRFRDEVMDKEKYLAVIEKYRDFDFGSFEVDTVEFVSNDWYQRIENAQTLGVFILGYNV